MLLQRFLQYWTLPRLLRLYIGLFCFAAVNQCLFLHQYNNYLMFARPFHNLLLDKSIYGLHPDLYDDNYKYSPTFAWLMGPFYYMPDWLGTVLWNLLNTVVLLLGVWLYLSNEKDPARQRRVALLIIVLEALITAQNLQSNNLIVGSMLLGLYFLRNERVWQAAFFFVLCGFIKFYGMAAAGFFLFYPKKPQFILAMIGWIVLLGIAPATIIPFDHLMAEYQEWFRVIVVSKLGLQVSTMGIAESWFGMAKTDANYRIIEMIGATLFLLPFLRFSLWTNGLFQRRMIAYFFLFIIVFNKMAESPTYVMAVTGVALWWLTLSDPTRLDKILLALVIIFTSLSPTDIFPQVVQKQFFQPYNIKAVGCLLVWARLQYQLWTQPKEEDLQLLTAH
ncbi:glycosyltransferase family 87 protein [Spirosoma sp.]|uniref:glycosyltransferase family 87 protein n=1 Tax=Spirosoma sp. TaxID=1899569 RepID=UPI00260329CD|nr:glycosyltransferase family 87 protein [Spirosoma sp.]MCX6214246.1 glycosyltransferase family 87 protein [Spirosoma sp.]